MSFREFIELEKEIVFKPVNLDSILKNHQNIAKQITQKLKKKDLKIIPLFKQYLKKGSFPLYVDYKSTTTYYRALEQVINTIIENDILAVYPKLTGVTIKRLKKLLNYISESYPLLRI